MSDYWTRHQELPLGIPEGEHPDINDLQDNAEAGLIKRGISRYLFSRNPERSVKMHTYLGASVVRKAIMGTYGGLIPRGPFNNYRTDFTKSRIEASTRFAVGGSVFNEAVHTGLVAWNTGIVVNNIAEGRNFTAHAFAVGVNAALVSLQRYNRARMAQRVNEELESGNGFRSSYQNWLGIDARAVENYKDVLEAQQSAESSADLATISPTPLRVAVPSETY